MTFKQYRIDVHVMFNKKINDIKGFLQVFGVSADNIEEAKELVKSQLKLSLNQTIEFKNVYEVDFDKFVKNLTNIKNPEIKGVWFNSGKIKYKDESK